MKWLFCSSKANLGSDSASGINMETAQPRMASPRRPARDPKNPKNKKQRAPNVDPPNSLGRGLDRLVDEIVHRVEDVDNPSGKTLREMRRSERRRHNTQCLDRFWTEQGEYTEREEKKRSHTRQNSNTSTYSKISLSAMATDSSVCESLPSLHSLVSGPDAGKWARLSAIKTPRRRQTPKPTVSHRSWRRTSERLPGFV